MGRTETSGWLASVYEPQFADLGLGLEEQGRCVPPGRRSGLFTNCDVPPSECAAFPRRPGTLVQYHVANLINASHFFQ